MSIPSISLDVVAAALHEDSFWRRQVQQLQDAAYGAPALHLAILVNPYLERILSGRKTIESRFSMQRRAPYQQIQQGDVVLFKRSGGPILGIGFVDEVMFYRLTPAVLTEIQTTYAAELGIDDPNFWSERAHAAYGTLTRLSHVRRLPPMPFIKRDQRAWLVLQNRVLQPQLLPAYVYPTAD
ncbi:MAG: ASCH domain-containing protein [Chloroflexales bacterium]|nr:ASCH domain-containing protein [Chloroflexales bacterium]